MWFARFGTKIKKVCAYVVKWMAETSIHNVMFLGFMNKKWKKTNTVQCEAFVMCLCLLVAFTVNVPTIYVRTYVQIVGAKPGLNWNSPHLLYSRKCPQERQIQENEATRSQEGIEDESCKSWRQSHSCYRYVSLLLT